MKSILHPFRLTSGILAAAAAAVCSLTVPAAAAASGDINGDGKLTKNDAVQLQKWLLTADASLADWRAGDMNQDNILDARDLTLLKRQIPEEEEEPQYIHLKGSSISYEGDHIQVSGKTAVINASGTYYIDGSLKDGQILVQIPDETVDTRTVKLFLNGVDMTNGDAPCILIENAENTSVNLVAGTVNKLSDGKEAPQEEQEPAFAVLHAKDDLTIKGEGELLISAGLQYGIH
jgi:hypothetical protein